MSRELNEKKCECEQPGHFNSGVPGILAYMENGVIKSKVERCDTCKRYPGDEEAKTALEVLLSLKQFTGTEHYYVRPCLGILDGIIYTDGVKYLAEKTKCYWLIDLVASYQHDQRFRAQPFQVWFLTVDQGKHTAIVQAGDGNKNIIATQEIPYTDFPLPEMILYLQINEDFRGCTLLLPSEY